MPFAKQFSAIKQSTHTGIWEESRSMKYLSEYQGHINNNIKDCLKAQLIKAVLQFRFDRQQVAKPRERNRINRLHSLSMMECYALGAIFP